MAQLNKGEQVGLWRMEVPSPCHVCPGPAECGIRRWWHSEMKWREQGAATTAPHPTLLATQSNCTSYSAQKPCHIVLWLTLVCPNSSIVSLSWILDLMLFRIGTFIWVKKGSLEIEGCTISLTNQIFIWFVWNVISFVNLNLN